MEQHQRSAEGSLTSLYSHTNQTLLQPVPEGAAIERTDTTTMMGTLLPETDTAPETLTSSTLRLGASSPHVTALGKADTSSSIHLNGGGPLTSAPLRATTIGTVVVRCGPIQLVIALLQVRTFKSIVLFSFFKLFHSNLIRSRSI